MLNPLYFLYPSTGDKSQLRPLGFEFYDIIGELILWQLIEINKPTNELQQLYYLSETGLNYARNR